MGYRCLFALLFVALVGCGGGGSDGPQVTTLVLNPLSGRSGGVDSGGGVTTTAGAPVGDDPTLKGYRIVQAFSLDEIPAGVEILSAVYQNEQGEVVGEPYATLGVVRVISADIGASLGPEDYAGPGLAVLHGTLSDGASLGVKTLDLTDFVRNQVAAGVESRLDIQLQFDDEHDSDGAFDQAVFYGPARTPEMPGIVVRYRE